MTPKKTTTEQRIVDFLVRYRTALSLFSIGISLLLATGAGQLYIKNDYNIFFKDDNPQKIANQQLIEEYARADDMVVVIHDPQRSLFTRKNLDLLQQATEISWQTPYATRVDSLTNYQYSRAIGDDLIVEDLVIDPLNLSDDELQKIEAIAQTDKQLAKRLISADSHSTVIYISLTMPTDVDPGADSAEQARQREEISTAFFKVVEHGNHIKALLRAGNPDLQVHLLGNPVINHAFATMAERDLRQLVPVMYAVIIIALAMFLRSAGGVLGTILVIGLATLAAMGFAGWTGYTLNSVNSAAPTIILTLAVCDSVHLLVIYLRGLGAGLGREQAMRESLLVNLQPIALTSVTTAVGFLTLNFSISPPFGELGNIAAFGVMHAMLLTLCLLPALAMLLARSSRLRDYENSLFTRFASYVIARRTKVLIATLAIAAGVVALVPLNTIDDDPVQYFDTDVAFRQAADFSRQTMPAIRDINFSLNCGRPGCINQPAYLDAARDFSGWLEQQPNVEFVTSYVDVISRINRNMHGDDPQYYKIPSSQELAAQYQLLYELSLPFGLDLNNQVNFDKSAIRISIYLRELPARQLIEFELEARHWLEKNYPQLATTGSSTWMMFAYLGEGNIRSMINGAIMALLGVTLTIFIALRSFRYAALSLIPNAFPAAITLGIWGAAVGYVNMAVASIFSISLGIIVDDTVHFISKYRRAREQKGLGGEASIHYAFSTVGAALVITTLVLCAGFALLATSSFNLNGHIGIMTAMTVVVALVFDFLVLPPLLLKLSGSGGNKRVAGSK